MDREIGSLAVLVMIFVLALKSIASPQCDEPWEEYGQACYLMIPEPRNWSSAQATCQSYGANLTWIHSEDEDRFIADMAARLETYYVHTADTVWIGMTDTSTGQGTWEWTYNDVPSWPTFTNWYPGEPDNTFGDEYCVSIRSDYAYFWDDARCDFTFSSVCKRLLA